MTEAIARERADATVGLAVHWQALADKLVEYLAPEARGRVEQAFRIGAEAHRGQTRKSGEPYITHPLAVAAILADMRLDADGLCAAILHDTLEDTRLSRDEIAAQFGSDVADLVDGVTKLDKVKFRDRQEANAESFRKMMLAMARDLRVILIKLADRLHNMRTLDAMSDESRRRIALETLEIYAPIAQRLGMNAIKAELQNHGFSAYHPLRHRVLEDRLRHLYGDRREGMARIQRTITEKLEHAGIPARLVSRVKSPYSIYTKMKAEHKSLAQVLDVYGVRVVVRETMQCYMALGAVHSLFKPVDGRFRDFIAMPKANGYQSLHTVLFGPGGTPIEVQIRTEDMDLLAERGIAAHWAYKSEGAAGNNAQSRAREWVAGLVDAQTRSDSSIEFVEHVKVDLFPDEVYLFTPKGDILALPRNATALDFAYMVHTHVGDHAVAARVDRKLVPLRTRLASGQSVEIITAASAQPQIGWLEFVVTSKARTAIRHALKQMQHEDAIEIGHRLLDRALEAMGSSIEQIAPALLDAYLQEHRLRRLEDLVAEIALGNRMPQQVAHALVRDGAAPGAGGAARSQEKILVSGAERGVVSFGNCCHPLPGDDIVGYLSAGRGIVVHQAECPNIPEFRKSPDRFVEIAWDREISGDFKVALKVVVENKPGVLATVAAAIAECQSNIDTVEYQERDLRSAAMLFVIEVKHRKHLAEVLRRLRRAPVVHTVSRYVG
ncbi:MAG: bifunctional (p)ppGpp synthetase/guanosine-3',5'-bis(diphosphate) 3'-pyrophosphohydrolase [Xanthomonadales bacterium]|nr:bifunctional (p)ppGpp synthetase/guanosine-3',5'-bis(diphosphate) 3'-pyrophosphohydrolase [Xanthomonadales bacterium]MCC6562295.1 bifunctional (p)ppGpp synthetase/guanosine-3',5'-bis(diphosphate) 3'-pyrophosphohydrolase [Xanthomonadales bacterium]